VWTQANGEQLTHGWAKALPSPIRTCLRPPSPTKSGCARGGRPLCPPAFGALLRILSPDVGPDEGALLGVQGGDGSDEDDILHLIAGLQDVDGLAHPQKDRPDGLGVP
jgi:hypothetical protein